jgi:hypothetical protein
VRIVGEQEPGLVECARLKIRLKGLSSDIVKGGLMYDGDGRMNAKGDAGSKHLYYPWRLCIFVIVYYGYQLRGSVENIQVMS